MFGCLRLLVNLSAVLFLMDDLVGVEGDHPSKSAAGCSLLLQMEGRCCVLLWLWSC